MHVPWADNWIWKKNCIYDEKQINNIEEQDKSPNIEQQPPFGDRK